jgi:hypothetical protein
LLRSTTLFAVTVTIVAEVTAEGAVYTPEAETVPSAGETDQLTAVFAVPVTLAVNCWLRDAIRVALTGSMETDTEPTGMTEMTPPVEAIGRPLPSRDAATVVESWAAKLPVADGNRVIVMTATTPSEITFLLRPASRHVL